MSSEERYVEEVLPHRLRELRSELGWSLDDVAQRVGVTQRGVVSNWEATNQRRRTPPLTTLLMLQKWYGASLDYIMGLPGADRDSPAVKVGKQVLRERLRAEVGLERASPSDRARLAARVAAEVAPAAFFLERTAANLNVGADELHELLRSGLWGDALLQNLAALLGLSVEWFYMPEPQAVLRTAE